ncbi:MAG: efflux RND transporter periplasmic adaptor subunit [Candidatus Omnitrophota bacterium]
MKNLWESILGKLKLVFWIALAVAAAFLVVKGCSRKPPEKKAMPKVVKAAEAEQKDAYIFLESFGNLYSPYDVNVMSQVTGEIKEVHFKDGDIVKTGDMLFTIDPSQYKATLDKAEAQLIQDLANLKLNKDTLERNRALLARELISQQDFEKYETNVTSTEAMIKLDNANIELAKINLGYCYISSPIDGVCGKRQVDPGNIVTANNGPVLVNIKTVDPLYVDFTIPERNLEEVRAAMSKNQLKVLIRLEKDGNNGGSASQKDEEDDASGDHEGQLHFVDNSVDNTTGTILLRAVVPNKDTSLWPGQFARVRLILREEKDAVIIPYEALQVGQKDGALYNYVFVVTSDNKADERNVKVGNKIDDHIIIEDGVKAGEKVVTAGQMGLREGVDVEISTPKTQQAQTKGK